MTINEGLSYLKLLKQRHQELVELRKQNKDERVFGIRTEKEYIERPAYDIKAIDRKAVAVAKEIRILDAAIKKANALVEIDFKANESVFEGIE